MERTKRQAAPEVRTDPPSLDELLADPEIAALLDFTPVPVRKRVGGWNPDAQRGFVAALAATGSRHRAALAVGRTSGGMDRILQRDDAESLRHAIAAAEAHAASVHGALLARNVADFTKAAAHAPPPGPGRKRSGEQNQLLPRPGQVVNEDGEYEDADSYRERGEDAMHGICGRLLRIRRLYLQEISASPGKRAAFEILTELPIDWEKAANCQPQDDEPYHNANQRKPDMILAAESGWTFGEYGYGPDKQQMLRQAIDEHRAEEGLPPVDWTGQSAE